nr:hypothetical protein [Mucilaginibacter sp. SP1R1]
MLIQNIQVEAKLKKFNQALSLIQKNNYFWFDSRHGEFPEQEHDIIFNHLFFEVDSNFVRFHFFHTSQLPFNIRRECQNAFNEIFHA